MPQRQTFKGFFGLKEIVLQRGAHPQWGTKGYGISFEDKKGFIYETFSEGFKIKEALYTALNKAVYQGSISLEKYFASTKDPLLGNQTQIKALVVAKKAYKAEDGEHYLFKKSPFSFY